MSYCPPLLRAIIIEPEDPERRGRCRVRIPQIHLDATPDNHLPWAEDAIYGGTAFGDLRTWKRGDTVFVMFEAGREELPIIVGGWSKVGDHPAGVYPGRDVWTRRDRFGNTLTFDARPGQEKTLLTTGESSVTLYPDGRIEIAGGKSVTVRGTDNVSVASTGSIRVAAGGNIAIVAGGSLLLAADAGISVQASGSGAFSVSAGGPMTLASTASIELRAPSLSGIASGNIAFTAGAVFSAVAPNVSIVETS